MHWGIRAYDCRGEGIHLSQGSAFCTRNSRHDRIALQHHALRLAMTSFQVCCSVICTYVLSLICLGIVRLWSTAPNRLAGNRCSRNFYQLPSRFRLPRLPPSHLCASTSRSRGSFVSLSMWFTRTCLQGTGQPHLCSWHPIEDGMIPLQIVWSRIFVLSFGTEGADISWRFVNQSMPYHLVFPLEASAAFRPGASWHWAVVGSILGMYICMRTWNRKLVILLKDRYRNLLQKILCLESWSRTSGMIALESSRYPSHTR